MSYILSLIIALITAALLVSAFIFATKKKLKLNIPRKAVAGTLALVTLVRYMIEREAFKINGTQGLNMWSPFGNNIGQTVLSMLLIWFTFASLFPIIADAFMKTRVLKHISLFFGVPVLIFDLVFFTTYITGVVGKDPYATGDVRIVLMAIEIGLALALAITRVIESGREIIPTKKEGIRCLLLIPPSLLLLMPSYAPWVLVGNAFTPSSMELEEFTFEHRIVLYFSLVVPYLIYRVLKDKSESDKRKALVYISLGALWTYMHHWVLADLLTPWRWPLHLCNTAMFIIPLCLIFKMKRLFNFTLFINVLGAMIAMFAPNVSEGTNVLEYSSLHFWLNHYFAFFMPILIIALGLFERPKFRQWVYSLIAFTAYFILVIFLNTFFTGIGHETDYFFLNSDFIVDKLGDWAEGIFEVTTTIESGGNVFVLRPFYLVVFYLVYVAFSVAVWFVYAVLFKFWDETADRRLKERDYKRMKKELTAFLGGRPINEPITGDSSPRLTLKNFSKRYGTNKHYSVREASFDVHGGEVFGFLGPNGAGKSTIIKSIVGIQTITSGNIEVCGYDVEKQSVQAKHELGFVPDHYALYENLTGREYINYIADLYGVSKKDRDERIEHYVSAFQLKGSFDNQMKTYSHGMKQKIAIMAALVHNPKLWILDEPLTGLDPNSIHEVKECMKAHAAAGNIVFFSSHIIDVVEKICDRIAIIKKGKIRTCISLKELEEKGIGLEEFYLSIINGEEPTTEAPKETEADKKSEKEKAAPKDKTETEDTGREKEAAK
jgi:ABC-2 type transport system ATP-binding protein